MKRRLLAVLILLALLLSAVPHFTDPKPTDAFIIEPSVITMEFWIEGGGGQFCYTEIWGEYGSYGWAFGYTRMYAQWRENGGEWIDSTRINLTKSGYTKQIWTRMASGRDMTVEVRGAIDRYWSGIYIGTTYGEILSAYIPPAAGDPWIATSRPYRISSTSISVGAIGDPSGEASGDIYAQYRKVGTGPWSETAKATITGFSSNSWTVSGLDAGEPYEARGALDYGATTIYGEILGLADEEVIEGIECEYQPAEGTGTAGDPYIITDVCELSWMRNDLAAYYELGNNIDASETHFWYWSGGDYEGFEPLSENPVDSFLGNFDGKGYTISGLYINRPTSDASLFGSVGTSMSYADHRYIRNVSFTNASVTGKNAGVLAAHISATSVSRKRIIENIHITGSTVVGSGTGGVGGLAGQADRIDTNRPIEFDNCSFEGSVEQTANYNVGGLLGGARGVSLYRVRASATVLASSTGYGGVGYAGGLVGSYGAYSCTMDESFSEGSVTVLGWGTGGWGRVGGLVGANWEGAITNSYSRSSVDGGPSATYGKPVGGLIGYSVYAQTITNSYSTGSVSGGNVRGGLIGAADTAPTIVESFWDIQTSGQTASAGGVGKTTSQMKTTSTFTNAGWDFIDIWSMDPSTNDGYPYLGWIPECALEVVTNYPNYIGSTRVQASLTLTEATPEAYVYGFAFMPGTTGTPTLDNDWATASEGEYGPGTYLVMIGAELDSLLEPETTYRLRAFAASDCVGVVWGNTVTFTTLGDPEVLTLPATEIAPHLPDWRTLHGYVTYDAGVQHQVRFEYGLSDTPPLGGFTEWRTRKPGVCPPRGYITDDFFNWDVSSLEMDSTYYFRAQLFHEDHGIHSGDILVFSTGEVEIGDQLVVVTLDATNYIGTQCIAHGAITVADPEAFRRGFVYMEGGVGHPTVSDSLVQQGGVFGPGSYSIPITGLNSALQYRIRAFAESDVGLVYGNTVTVPPDAEPTGVPVMATYAATDIGGTSFRARGEIISSITAVTERGFVYLVGSTGTPTLADNVVDEMGSWGAGTYSRSITGLAEGTSYRVRAYGINSAGTGYGTTVTVRTLGLPAVTTNAATNIATTTARLQGRLDHDGGEHCQYRFQWGYATGVYTYSSSWTNGLTSATPFYLDLAGLTSDTTYYFRAQARNGYGTVSGAELTFDTIDSLLPPTAFDARALSDSSIILTWGKGSGAHNTVIQMSTGTYPTDIEDGIRVYFDTGTTYTVTGLEFGMTYYFSGWSEAEGDVSATYATAMATTLADEPWDEDPTPPDEPDDWFTDPDPSGLVNMPFYDQINDLFDSMRLPHTTGWIGLALLLAAIAGVGTQAKTHTPWIAITASGFVIVAAVVLGLLALWPLIIILVIGGGYAYIRSRP